MKENLQELIRLVQENPELPVVCEVNGEICDGDEYMWGLGELGACWVGSYTFYEGRFYDNTDRDAFEEDYFDLHDDELWEEFWHEPRPRLRFDGSRCTPEQRSEDAKKREAIEKRLGEIADQRFKPAIIVLICAKEEEE